jgi:thioredoxin reductase
MVQPAIVHVHTDPHPSAESSMRHIWDAVIVGGGPAGLSAALILGRCCRNVLIVDEGRQRNRFAAHMHGFLTRDGTPPHEFLSAAREQLRPYSGVRFIEDVVEDAACSGKTFTVTLQKHEPSRTRTLLLATGVVDHLPAIPGIEPLYGTSVHHCPYCDGWEWRQQRIAAYGSGDDKGGGLALMLRQWSSDVALFSDGPADLSIAMRSRLRRHNISVHEAKVERLDGEAGRLKRVVLSIGAAIERDALFFNTGQHQRSVLASRLGCKFTDRGGVDAGELDVATGIEGLFVAGDVTRDVQLVAIAAAEGVKAAFAINKLLLTRDGLL